MVDDRVPGIGITEGRRQPVLLSKAARERLAQTSGPTFKALTDRLERIGTGLAKRRTVIEGKRYLIADVMDYLIVYRSMASDELTKQGYSGPISERGGIFVLAILRADELADLVAEQQA